MSFQYFAICSVSSALVFVAVPFIEVKFLGRIGESAFAEAGVISCLQHALKTIEGARQVGVVTETGAQTPRQSWLFRVDLPGMNIGHDGQAFFLYAFQSQSCVDPRQQPKIAAPPDWHIVPSQAKSGDGKLRHRARRRLKTERSTRRPGHPITVMVNGENAGVVSESEFGQNFQRPNGTVDHRIGWSAISGNGLAPDLLNYVFGAPRILFELSRFQLVDQAVPVGMTGQLMSTGCDLAYQCREALGDPP